jgi:hypothetical protein
VIRPGFPAGCGQLEHDQVGRRCHPHSEAIGEIRHFRMGNGVGDPHILGGELHRRPLAAWPGGRRPPVVPVLVAARMIEAGSQECGPRNVVEPRYRDVDVERGARLRRADLHRHAADQRVRHALPVEQISHEPERPVIAASSRCFRHTDRCDE